MRSEYKKGDRVMFNTPDGVKVGTVVRGGSKKVSVLADGCLDMEYSGPSVLFKHATSSLPKDDPSPMDHYSIIGYKEIHGHGDTRTFEAKICLDGTPIIHVSNDGWGGSDFFQPLSVSKSWATQINAFLEASKSWAAQFGYPDMLEPESMWVEWYQHERPYGVLAVDSIRRLREVIKGDVA